MAEQEYVFALHELHYLFNKTYAVKQVIAPNELQVLAPRPHFLHTPDLM